MSGRHRVAREKAPRRSRRPRRVPSGLAAGLVALVVAVVGVIGFTGVRWLKGAEPAGCPAKRLRVVAAPEIADVVASAARAVEPSSTGSCSSVNVQSMTSEAAEHSVEASGGTAVDVWIPESTQWLLAARDATKHPDALPDSGPSVARSPIVIAMPHTAAQQLGAPSGPVPWARAAAAATSPRSALEVGLPTPEAYPASTSTLVALRGIVGQGTAGRDRLVALMRQMRQHVPDDPAALLEIVAATDGAKPTLAAPASEQAVWAFNSHASDGTRVSASYVAGAPALDYPFLVLARDARAKFLADRLREKLAAPAAVRALKAHGFRTATGAAGDAVAPAVGLDPHQPAQGGLAEAALVAETLKTFDAVTLESRMLTVLDVSGSMGVLVPGSGGASRMDVTRQAAARGLGLFPPSSQVGLWEFSTALTPKTDYRQLVPIGRLDAKVGAATQRQAIAAELAKVQPVYGGSTGLYDTTLAAVRSVRSSWQPGYENTVLLFTDGKNEDASSIQLNQLLQTLRKENDPKRPVPVIAIGFGPDIDLPALRAIATATDGKAYQANSAAQIQNVFLDAISTRACRPNC